jgi:hypothetical protein
MISCAAIFGPADMLLIASLCFSCSTGFISIYWGMLHSFILVP